MSQPASFEQPDLAAFAGGVARGRSPPAGAGESAGACRSAVPTCLRESTLPGGPRSSRPRAAPLPDGDRVRRCSFQANRRRTRGRRFAASGAKRRATIARPPHAVGRRSRRPVPSRLTAIARATFEHGQLREAPRRRTTPHAGPSSPDRHHGAAFTRGGDRSGTRVRAITPEPRATVAAGVVRNSRKRAVSGDGNHRARHPGSRGAARRFAAVGTNLVDPGPARHPPV